MTTTPNRSDDRPRVERAAESEWLDFGGTSRFRVIAEGGSGVPDLIEFRATRGDGPPMHRHPWPSWELVIDGNVRIVIDGREYRAGPGDTIYVPAGVGHTYRVESDTARIVGMNMSDGRFPALQRNASKLLRSTDPDLARLEDSAAAHGVEILGPPLGTDPGR